MEGALAGFLRDSGVVSEENVQTAEHQAGETGEQFLRVLSRVTGPPADDIVEAISTFYQVEKVATTTEWPSTPATGNSISLTFLRAHGIFPMSETDNAIVLAMSDPGDTYARKAVELATGKSTIAKVASAEEIEAALERCARHMEETRDDDITVVSDADVDDDVQHLRDIALGTPVVRLVNKLFQDAIHSRATDIHIEPFDGHLEIRFRTDGVLRELRPPPVHMGRAIVSRIKILASLNIAERRLPQDGRVRIRVDGRQIDMRVATIPTIHGEAVAIRLLDNVRRKLDLDLLGFNTRDRENLVEQIASPHGMIVVTGPTGSGKTTTLATLLSRLNDRKRKILTIEDPIEYDLDGVNQTQAKPSIGLTFAHALRSFLRHDPDVIMVGEMRDGETAGIGVHAALTGHLVLTTLHTNTAAGAIPRLLDMGVDDFLLASSLRCVVGQRLLRKLCPACKVPHETAPTLPPRLADVLKSRANGQMRLWRAVGCDRCYGTGYSDRTVISEVLLVNSEIASMIHSNASVAEIEQVARRNGMTTMLEDGFSKCLAGETTTDEVLRVSIEL